MKNAQKTVNHRGNSTESHINKDVILRSLNILPGQTIMDVGCGNGYMTKEFSRLVNNTGKVYVIDRSKKAIEKLKQETKDINIILLVADITNENKITIKDASIDLIYLSTVFHVFSEEQIGNFQKIVIRLLKTGGNLVIVNIDKKATSFGPPQNMRVSPEELKQLIKMTPVSFTKLGEYFYMQIFEKK